MKKLHFEYEMKIDYSIEVSKCNFTIKCIPKSNARQRVNDIQIDIKPETMYYKGKDGLNNLQIYGANNSPHNYFDFRITGEVETGLSEYEEPEDDSLSMIFAHPHGLNVAGENLRKYYSTLAQEIHGDNISCGIFIMERLYKDFEYRPNTTRIDTTAEAAFTQGFGVCQDYAHIFISLLHLCHIPARYVTGFVIGEGASHAWVEILQDGKWYGLDPTNNQIVKDNHIKLCVGRDAGDCLINRGIMHGGGLHTQTIKVNVGEI